MTRRRLWRFLKAWLLPARHLEALAGWWQLTWMVLVIVIPAGVAKGVTSYLKSASWSVVAGVVVGVLLFLALWALWRQLPAPALSVNVGAVQDVLAVDPRSGNTTPARYLHFEVHSPSPVRNVRANLIRVETQSGTDFMPTGFKPPVPLLLDSVPGEVWKLVEPDLPARINLVCQQGDFRNFAALCLSNAGPTGNLGQIPFGTHRLSVRVFGEDVAPQDAVFIIHAGPTLSDLSALKVES